MTHLNVTLSFFEFFFFLNFMPVLLTLRNQKAIKIVICLQCVQLTGLRFNERTITKSVNVLGFNLTK